MYTVIMLQSIAIIASVTICNAFQSQPMRSAIVLPLRATEEDAIPEIFNTISELETFLTEKYPAFHTLVKGNQDVWKTIKDTAIGDGEEIPRGGFTVFAPNAKAFENLKGKKNKQLADPRNIETVEKIGAYHFISEEAVSAERLRREDWTKPKTADGNPVLKVGGIMTLGGEIPVGRSKSGGFIGFGAKEGDGIVVGNDNAEIIESFTVGNCIVHEVDALVSPVILWRYCDQLRIPFSS
mmetsp:Transcript_51963/g.60728  ORF Transcript_51963/g.60728 Transcript_51963/m.60728 type:complete len:239 (-) Transcript_51963:124-840(-)